MITHAEKDQKNGHKPVSEPELTLFQETQDLLKESTGPSAEKKPRTFRHPYVLEILIEIAIILGCVVLIKILSSIYLGLFHFPG